MRSWMTIEGLGQSLEDGVSVSAHPSVYPRSASRFDAMPVLMAACGQTHQVMRTSCDKESHTPEAGKVLWDLSHALVTGKTKLPRERRSAAASFWRSPAVIIIFIFMLILPILAALFGPEGNPWALLLRR
mmetsp:Transcript_69244/g.184614  ORF Transcript_69244/g.184614 Transcript_69244/m.184614 type:complete len:130 (+) Transcript_69244:1456-1845(+)